MHRVISLKTPFVLAVYVFTDQKKADGNVHLYHYHNIIQEVSALNQHLCCPEEFQVYTGFPLPRIVIRVTHKT